MRDDRGRYGSQVFTRVAAGCRRARKWRRIAIVFAGVFALVMAAKPSVAWADGSGTTSILPTNLWIAPLAGGCAAVGAVTLCVWRSRLWTGPGWSGSVPATSAWDVQDSWVTNITALGGTLTGVFSATALSSFFNSTNTDGFTVLSLIFGGVTVLAPVVYGALAKAPTAGSSAPTGSRGGLVLASATTLFAAFGLMADIGLLVSYTIGTSVEKGLVDVGLAFAFIAVTTYAVRSVDAMVNPPAPDKNGMVAASVLSSAQRTSGTL